MSAPGHGPGAVVAAGVGAAPLGAGGALGGGFAGADVAALDRVAGRSAEAADRLAALLAALRTLIVSLRAAAWFTGGASVAYAEHLETVVVPWVTRVEAALRLAAEVLAGQAAEQRDASAAGYTTPALPVGDCRLPPSGAPWPAAGDGPPRLPTDPAAVAAHLAAMDRAGAERLADRHPALIGRLDGAPAWLRDRANRHLLALAVADLEARRAVLRAEIDARRATGRPVPDERTQRAEEGHRELERVEGELVTLRRIARDPDVQLLVFDHDRGRIAAAIGDVDTATHVATIVPGTFADVAGFGGYLDRADELRFTTQQASGTTSVATIAWLDYAAPPNLVAAMSPGRATDAATSLAGFTDGLVATNPDARRSVLGHSYGATVVGETAARFHLDVDTVIGIGAPGMRVDSVDRFRLPEDARVYAVTDREGPLWRRDPISFTDGTLLTGALGRDPYRIGAGTFDVSDADAHDLERYLSRDTRAGRNVGAVVAGVDPQPRP